MSAPVTPRAVITKIHREIGVADQTAFHVTVTYPDIDTTERRATFVGRPGLQYAPVVLITETWGQVFVDSPGRFGVPFGREWIRRFYGVSA